MTELVKKFYTKLYSIIKVSLSTPYYLQVI